MKLQELLKDVAVKNSTAAQDIEIKEVRYDSRAVQPGDLFVAIRGYATDGHKYIAKAMEQGKFIANADSLVTAAMERESVLSTAMEGGLAFPHVRGVEGGGLTLAMGISQKGIDWDGEQVNIVFLSAIPVAVSAFYLRLMAGLTQAFSKEANRKAVLGAKDAASLWKALQKATRTTVK